MDSVQRMDQRTAVELVKKGGTLLLLGVPQFTLFGIDAQVFSVGQKFKGIKMLPPGPHFVYYCSPNKEGNEFSPTTSFFITSHSFEVIVRKWCPQDERLIRVLEDEEDRYSDAVKHMEFDQHLAPYALDCYGAWKQLSGYISKSIISRLEPIGGEISIANETLILETRPKTDVEKRLMMQLKDSAFSQHDSVNKGKPRCYYTTIPKVFKDRGSTGEELTALNLDKTKLIESILTKDYGGEEDTLLGELQFAFVAFMMGQSLEAFMHWKDMVTLLFSCRDAPLQTRSQLFVKFIRVIYYQLKHGFLKGQKEDNSVNDGISYMLDVDWFSTDTFLYRLCMDFFLLVLDAKVIDGDLLLWTRKLKKLLETTMGWVFVEDSSVDGICDPNDEFAPVVVPLHEAEALSP